MTKLTLHRRLRPLRIAFLIKPGDRAEFRRAVQTCSVLWGGQFNFIVQATRRIGRGRGRSGRTQATAKAQLEAIEPDFVVAGKIDPRTFGVPEEQSRSFDDFLKPGGDRIGIDIMAVYKWRYQKEFKFVLRDPIPLRRCRGTGPLSLLAITCFGEAPAGRRRALDRAFDELGGETQPFEPERFAKVWSESITPLRLGASEIQIKREGRATFLLLDPQNVGDLVDLWNLRALGWRVFPIPTDWSSALAPRVSDWIAQHHKPSPALQAVVTRAVISRGDGVSDRELTTFLRKLEAPAQNFAVQLTVPRVTSASPLDDLRPPKLAASEDETSVEASLGGFSFNCLRPEFDTGYGGLHQMCATVATIKSWSLPGLPEVFPRGLPDEVLGGLARRGTRRIHTEGITLLDDGRGSSCYLDVPSGLAVFQGWLAPRTRVAPSAAGKIAHRMLHTMGGPRFSQIWTKPSIVRLFDKMNESASRSVSHAEFMDRLRKECIDDAMTARIFKQWIDRRAIALGMRLQCDKCGQRNWTESATQFRTVECHRCLESFAFPSARPRRDVEWAVRPLGPFSVEGHAHGAFAVAAALRLLEDLGAGTRTTWMPSVTLSTGSTEREVDFIMLRHDELRPSMRPLLLLGECKTFTPFDKGDIDKMAELGQEFPGAVLVFATLSDSLGAKESRLLKKLAARCRRRPKANPVLLLTSRELSGDFGPPHCWQDGSVEEQAVAETMKQWQFDFLRICDASVQLRLGLQPLEDRILE